MKTATAPSVVRRESLVSDLMELTKARLSLMALLTTLVGFLIGWDGPMDYLLLSATVVGTALCAAGAAALNQWWERDYDALMKRTSDRPLPSGRMLARDALLFGLLFCVAGLAILWIFTNIRAAFLAFATIGIYVIVYTPLKRMTTLNTLVGAIPGALPPLIGWVAARGVYQLEGSLLFMILWFWQMPHFLAIAWMYREEYAEAGYVMISNRDTKGYLTSRQALLYSLCLLVVSLLPALLFFANYWYFAGALLLGLPFCAFAFRFAMRRDRVSARALFLFSVLYLPLLLVLFVLTKR
jgi:heme o synthase